MDFGASVAATGPLDPVLVSVLLQAARQVNATAYKIFFIREYVDIGDPVCKNRGSLLFLLLNVLKKNWFYRENTIENYVGC